MAPEQEVALRLRFHRLFLADVEEYGGWFEEQLTGLADDFAAELELALQALSERPMSYRIVWKQYRRVLVRRFRILIPFEVVDETVLVLGVVHGTRDLPSWIQRRTTDKSP